MIANDDVIVGFIIAFEKLQKAFKKLKDVITKTKLTLEQWLFATEIRVRTIRKINTNRKKK